MTSPRRIVSTYRLQLRPEFTFDDAAAQVGRLAALGVSHLYLSPVLQASAGSTHGYDVVDHRRVSAELGGEAGLRRLVRAARGAGLGIVLDIVPNHMAAPVPLSGNVPLWSVLRDGPTSACASWFDVEWASEDGKVLWPVLGAPLEQALAEGELVLDRVGGEDVVRYHDHVLPLARGTNRRGMPLGSVLASQHYRLASWREAATRLNYRRFFDVDSLVGLRVEDPEVFDATHRVVVDLVRRGDVDGLRIDHPDGLADPAGYLERLAQATDGAWTVVEKILEGEERLPDSWACAGTTGYDALLRVGGLFVDPACAEDLAGVSKQVLGREQRFDELALEAKRHVVEHVLAAEVSRLMRTVARALPGLDLDGARSALIALLVGLDRYRVYVRPGAGAAGGAAGGSAGGAAVALEAAAARGTIDGQELDRAVLEAVIDLALGQASGAEPDAQAEFVIRFQQTCGPVMAKAVEDTTYYRYVRLVSLNEVGGDPAHAGVSVRHFHEFAQRVARDWPQTMTTLSTHDTKRSEDVRARLAVLSGRADAWAEWIREARRLGTPHRNDRLDALTEYLLWQTLVGAWPITVERLAAYATKAIREAKLHTSWTDVDRDYEAAVQAFVAGVASDPAVVAHVGSWVAATAHETRANILAQKVIQLLMPGVPDVYQGTEVVDLSLVDPDNRRPVDHNALGASLARLDDGGAAAELDDEKLHLTATALRLRRQRPEVFVGARAGYAPLATSTEQVVAFRRGDGSRGDVCVLATRFAGRLRTCGGWGDDTIELPVGGWRDLLSDKVIGGGQIPLAEVLAADGLPVAILVRDEGGPAA